MLAISIRLRLQGSLLVRHSRFVGHVHATALGRDWRDVGVHRWASNATRSRGATVNDAVLLAKALEFRGITHTLSHKSSGGETGHSPVSQNEVHLTRQRTVEDSGLQEEDGSGFRTYNHFETRDLGLNQQRVGHKIRSEANLSKGSKRLLAEFIQNHFDAELQSSLESNPAQVVAQSASYFDDDSKRFLAQEGYDYQDVLLWTWIISAKDASAAAARLDMVIHASPDTRGARRVPSFLFTSVLKRPYINAPALRQIWLLILELLRSQPQDKQPVLGGRTFNVIMIKVLRHARIVWPESLPDIATEVASYWSKAMNCGHTVDMTKVTFFFNKMLGLFAIPSSRFHQNFLFHQKAMHSVVSAMTEFDPPLLLSREGHRAIVRLQLAHRKTDEEIEWAKMKAPSWPPWRNAKLGIEENVGTEQGITRAGSALSLLYGSGYESRNWDDVAKIYAGWDTDNSPTIQTRTTVPAPPTLQERGESPESLWASRIRATRTAEEAWKIFLDCRDGGNCPMNQPYSEMLRKLALKELGHGLPSLDRSANPSTEQDGTLPVLPGDSLELATQPQDPRMRPYLHVAIPELEEFLSQAFADGFRLDGRLLAFLLKRRPSYSMGQKILTHSSLPNEAIRALTLPQQPNLQVLTQIDAEVLAGVVSWLASLRSQWEVDLVKLIKYSSWHDFRHIPGLKMKHRLVLHAFRLLCVSKPPHAPAWNALFDALSCDLVSPTDRINCRTIVEMWALHSRLVEELQQVDQGARFFFPSMCEVFTEALASQLRLQERNKGFLLDLLNTKELKTTFEQWTGTRMQTQHPFRELKRYHKEKNELSDASVPNPGTVAPLLAIPDARQLHYFARALAVAVDYKGIGSLVLWLQQHLDSLRLRMQNVPPKKCLLAVRVGLEDARRHHGAETVSDECLAMVRHAIVEMYGDHAWPSDAAVDDYVAKPKSQRLRLGAMRSAGEALGPTTDDVGTDTTVLGDSVRKVVPKHSSDSRWS